MTGEITIMGRVLPVGGIREKIQAAFDASITEVIIPEDNIGEANSLPRYILDTVKVTPVSTIQQVLEHALKRSDEAE